MSGKLYKEVKGIPLGYPMAAYAFMEDNNAFIYIYIYIAMNMYEYVQVCSNKYAVAYIIHILICMKQRIYTHRVHT